MRPELKEIEKKAQKCGIYPVMFLDLHIGGVLTENWTMQVIISPFYCIFKKILQIE